MGVVKFVRDAMSAAWPDMPRSTVVIGGHSFEAVDNGGDLTSAASAGGMVPDDQLVLMTQVNMAPSPDILNENLGKRCTVNGHEWRLVRWRFGKAAIELEFQSVNQS